MLLYDGWMKIRMGIKVIHLIFIYVFVIIPYGAYNHLCHLLGYVVCNNFGGKKAIKEVLNIHKRHKHKEKIDIFYKKENPILLFTFSLFLISSSPIQNKEMSAPIHPFNITK